jgi:hypothetical protein
MRTIFGGAALLAVVYSIAHAAGLNSASVGTQVACGNSSFVGSANISTLGGPATFSLSAVNAPKFEVVALGSSPSSVSLQPVSWTGSGSSPTLGSMSWQFDVSRSVANTTLTANQLGSDFPATAQIRFHVTGTIAAYPGVTFISQTPVVLVGTINSYNPYVNESFSLASSVVFVDKANPTTGPSFTMTSFSLALNG